jgi:hypothetical protein
MTAINGIIPEDIGASSLRAPLRPRTASPPTVPSKQIRRKSAFLLHSDSSDDLLSSHDSIFEALYFSADNSDESGNRVELINLPPRARGKEREVNDENSRGTASSADTYDVDEVEFRYGHGTVLDTITEQKSCATIRTLAHTKSADNMPKIPFLDHWDNFVVARGPLRKMSFSLDDLNLIKRSYHEACAMIEREAHKPLPVHEIYAQPKVPIHAPLDRPPTPPGMPSWTVAQTLHARSQPAAQPVTPNRFQRFFGLPAYEFPFSSRVAPMIPSRVSSAPVQGRLAPRFRPPRSAYGAIDRHPFMTAPFAPIAKTDAAVHPVAIIPSGSPNIAILETRPPQRTGKRKLSKRVRFTPSATARDSEMVSLQNAMESTRDSAMHPMLAAPTIPQTQSEQRLCPHQKSRLAKLKYLQQQNSLNHQASAPPSNEYHAPSTPSPSPLMEPIPFTQSDVTTHSSELTPSSRRSSLDGSFGIIDIEPNLGTRIVSISSTVHLMSGGLHSDTELNPATTVSPLEEKQSSCWKCKVNTVISKVDQWFMDTTDCLCFGYGFDTDDDYSVQYGGTNAAGMRGSSGTAMSRDFRGSRMVILRQTPVVM